MLSVGSLGAGAGGGDTVRGHTAEGAPGATGEGEEGGGKEGAGLPRACGALRPPEEHGEDTVTIRDSVQAKPPGGISKRGVRAVRAA